ncbi:MAG: sigma 54-interacting transcriptional regulator, partial [Deltaproteobacteria bacterium]|nr:sigma 54-interacting transcriptional regulator [Deltaproteobacteria bacterium]
MRRLLVINGAEEIASTLASAFGAGVEITRASSTEEGVDLFRSRGADVVITAAGPPGAGEFDTLERVRVLDPFACVIVVAGTREMGSIVGAVKRGAFDCVSRPVDFHELEQAVRRAFNNIELHGRLKDIAVVHGALERDTIVGKSRAMEEIFKTIGAASQGKVTILIQGESGTGKELIARAIHLNSREADRPFIPINCSALVETLLESELFGQEKGAFTGAVSRKEGKFEAANGGTVFLDEIGEMSPPLQVKLLRFL